jgi:hypothetical protein
MSSRTTQKLTDNDVNEFHEIGWFVKPALFRRDEVARMRKCFDRLEWLAQGMRETGLKQGSHFVLGEKNGTRIIKRVVWAGGSQPYLLLGGADPLFPLPCAHGLGSRKL